MSRMVCAACWSTYGDDGKCGCDSTTETFGPLTAEPGVPLPGTVPDGRICAACGDEIDERGFCLCDRPEEPAPEDPRVKAAGNNPKDAIGDRKVPLWLCSPIAKAHWALAQMCGLIKYGAWNWRKAGVRSSVYLSAAQRHLDAYMSGERYDPVDGTHHLGNLMACAAILLDAEAAGKVIDDRPPSVDLRPTYAEVEGIMARLREKYVDLAPRHYTIEDTE